MLISELETIIDETFTGEDGSVRTVDTVYEATDEGYKLVISIHGLMLEDTSIIHTKFIFKTDKDKREVTEMYFHY